MAQKLARPSQSSNRWPNRIDGVLYPHATAWSWCAKNWCGACWSRLWGHDGRELPIQNHVCEATSTKRHSRLPKEQARKSRMICACCRRCATCRYRCSTFQPRRSTNYPRETAIGGGNRSAFKVTYEQRGRQNSARGFVCGQRTPATFFRRPLSCTRTSQGRHHVPRPALGARGYGRDGESRQPVDI